LEGLKGLLRSREKTGESRRGKQDVSNESYRGY